MPVTENVARAAEGEVLAIADGLPRDRAEQRARQAFESANEIRGRYRGLPEVGKRAAAVSRARTWAQVLRHMDATGEPEFCGCTCDDTPPAVVRAVWAACDWLARVTWRLNLPGYVRAFRDLLGAEPITFYEPPEQADEGKLETGEGQEA